MIIYCNDCKYKRIHLYEHATCKKNPTKYKTYAKEKLSYDVCWVKNKDNDCLDFKPKLIHRRKYK